MSKPWIDKYIPTSLEEIIGNKEIISRFINMSQKGDIPNMIIYGDNGIGKTSSIHCLAKKLIPDKLYNDAVLELNTSEDRGIGVIRNKIKCFAKKKVNLPKGVNKIIIMDEADSIQQGSQQALRRIIECYSYNTRFIFICNEITKIIEPLQSRCCIFKFNKLKNDEIKSFLKNICNLEKIDYTDEGLDNIIITSNGDLRQVINNLQSIYYGYKNITRKSVLKTCNIIESEMINNAIKNILENDFINSYQTILKLNNMGILNIDIIDAIFHYIKDSNLEEKIKMLIIKELSFINIRIMNGIETDLQLGRFLSKISQITKYNY